MPVRTRRRLFALAVGLLLAATGFEAARAGPLDGAPLPEPEFLAPLPDGEGACTPDNAYEAAHWDRTVGPYADAGLCERLRFAYGPITVRPGQNDALIVPIVIEKPAYDGYVLRFKPDLVYANGTPPRVDQIHLHHAVWLRAREIFGGGILPGYSEEIVPFFAAGEEKTIATLPTGYGYPVTGADSWLLLYMVHNYTTSREAVWITYDLDYVPKAAAEARGITPVYPVWVDVQRRPIAANAPDTPANPVFNVQRGYGHVDADLGQGVCTWPKENCAAFDSYGDVTAQQGTSVDVDGAYETLNAELGSGSSATDAGTLVWIGGHLHPGGIRDDIELVRSGQSPARIFSSDAVPWDRADASRAGGPYDSWDFSMTVTGAHLGWKVNVQRGDRLRINATYDSEVSWYENMGIVVAFVARGQTFGLDPFASTVAIDQNVPSGAVVPEGWRTASCTPGANTLCTRGQPTHGSLPESRHFGGDNLSALPSGAGPVVDTVEVAGFAYGLADQNVIFGTGQVPQVRAGQTTRFVSVDSASDIWHTVTRCAAPCSGASGLDYPKADGADFNPGTPDDYDSAEIGWGLFLSPAKVHVDDELEELFRPPWSLYDVPLFADEMNDGVLWEFTPSATDVNETVTFFCRIHIGMRGAVKVVA